MPMHQLTIDETLCINCGSCETALPGLMAKMHAGRLLISQTNLAAHDPEIHRAVNSCRQRALTLEEVTQ